MNRELFLLNPYRLPAHHTLLLQPEEAAVLLNGYLTLWHPAALLGAQRPPEIASAYDHEQPQPGRIYAFSESPPLFLPEDWHERARQVGAVVFSATADRNETERSLLEALGAADVPPEEKAPWYALGLGYLVLGALCEAMDHENVLVVADFWGQVQQALACQDPQVRREHLRQAAEMLREARRVTYDSTTYLLDLVLLEEQPQELPFLAGLDLGAAVTLISSTQALERRGPQFLQRLRQALDSGVLEIAGGVLQEREDALLPVESQLWNLRAGLLALRRSLAAEVTTFARRRFGFGPQSPLWLTAVGLKQAVLLAFDEGVLPVFHSAVVEWYVASGEQIRSYARKPLPAESPLTYFHLAYHLAKTLRSDMVSSLAFLHRDQPPASYYRDWLELHRLAPVFGQPATLHRFLSQAGHGEYSPPRSADDFHSDYLNDRVQRKVADPISWFCRRWRQRRRIDNLWTAAALVRALPRGAFPAEALARWQTLEERWETGDDAAAGELDQAAAQTARHLAERIVARGPQQPGWVIVNPCSFPRMVCLELEGVQTPLPPPARATQLEAGKARVVVETPGLGFAWLPRAIPPGTRVLMPKGKLAEELQLRNDQLVAEVDATTGGLRSIRRARQAQGRLGQQLVFGPGSQMRARTLRVTSSGPALGEIVSEGDLLDASDRVLASFVQTFRLWWARPVLELRVRLEPREPPAGYPWHAYYGMRFAWRDPRTPLARGAGFDTFPTTHPRPETPLFLELRQGSDRTAILTGGLPFLQRQGNRMLDLILICEGETAREFDIGLALDADDPLLAAWAFLTPPLAIPVDRGPPAVGASGWLFHVDADNVLAAGLWPASDGADAVVVRLAEIRGVPSDALLRCPRRPVRAFVVNEWDVPSSDLPILDDAVQLTFAASEMKRIRIHFS